MYLRLFSLLAAQHMLIGQKPQHTHTKTRRGLLLAMRKHLQVKRRLPFTLVHIYQQDPPPTPHQPAATFNININMGENNPMPTCIYIVRMVSEWCGVVSFGMPDDNNDDDVRCGADPKEPTESVHAFRSPSSWCGKHTVKWLVVRSCVRLVARSKVIMQIAKAYHWNGTRNVGWRNERYIYIAMQPFHIPSSTNVVRYNEYK